MPINGSIKIENGILKAHLKSFTDMFKFSSFFHNGIGQYYFRGQSNANWNLETTLERFERQLNPFTDGTKDFLLKEFKRLIRGKGLLKEINATSDEDFFCLGQHYGLPTPMLDWTESFYISLFFAFADEIPIDVENIAVWAIQTSASDAMDDWNSSSESSLEIKFVDPFSDVNSRLISQSGMLLQKPSGVDLEDLISKYCRGNSHSPVLAKLTMPAKERENVINALFSMNINWATIYPGIEGAAKHAKMKLQILDSKARKIGESALMAHSQKSITGL